MDKPSKVKFSNHQPDKGRKSWRNQAEERREVYLACIGEGGNKSISMSWLPWSNSVAVPGAFLDWKGLHQYRCGAAALPRKEQSNNVLQTWVLCSLANQVSAIGRGTWLENSPGARTPWILGLVVSDAPWRVGSRPHLPAMPPWRIEAWKPARTGPRSQPEESRGWSSPG